MINTATLSIFISYSRKDSTFVDRLEADLRARNFLTWVDRRKLEGGQNWMDMLQRAIDRCNVLLVVLSPDAVDSDYVKMEYRYAKDQGKLVIPVELHTCPRVPIDLNGIQWVTFKSQYDQGLKDLMIALSPLEGISTPPVKPNTALFAPGPGQQTPLAPPQPAPRPINRDLNELYKAGITARASGDLERTAVLWQQVLDRDPNFQNGTLAQRMAQMAGELRIVRIQRLRQQAEQAHREGMWRQAIGAWQALLGLEPQDIQAQAFLPVAQHNQKYELYYDNASQFIRDGMLPSAKTELELLWRDAPYYGDPQGLARSVGLPAPSSSLDYKLVRMTKQKAQTAKTNQNKQPVSRQDALRELGVSTGEINFWVFCTVTGLSSIISNSSFIYIDYSQSYFVALLALPTLTALVYYALNYRKVMTLTSIISIAMLSCLVVIALLIGLSGSRREIAFILAFILGIPTSISILIYRKVNLIIIVLNIVWIAIALFPLSAYHFRLDDPLIIQWIVKTIVSTTGGAGLGATLFIQRKEVIKGFRFVLTKLGLM